MPRCGSQIILCDVPVRFDTYVGCSHACSYCFVQRKVDIKNIELGESAKTLKKFIEGERTLETSFVDWDIPLHWGGVSDPFQPAEKYHKRSYECLKVFKETKYPFIVSTKNKMIADDEYLELIKDCNCVVQFSAACVNYDKLEQGASTFQERLEAARKISAQGVRVNIRVQPYLPQYFNEIMQSLDLFAEAGVYGCIFESMKYQKKVNGTIKIGGDFVYPTKVLYTQFKKLKDKCHKLGMKFYSGENRLRQISDNLCCCGVDGMGWKLNTANLNHLLFDKDGVEWTNAMKKKKSGYCFKCIHQDSKSTRSIAEMTFQELMLVHFNENYCKVLLPEK